MVRFGYTMKDTYQGTEIDAEWERGGKEETE